MKTKPSSRETRTAPPGVNLEMLLDYLHKHVYNGTRANTVVIANVVEYYNDGHDGPYGIAEYIGRDVSFRLKHFHRIASVVPNEDPPMIVLGERIWILVGVTNVGKEFAVRWGRVEELPASFMIPTTFMIKLIRWIDSRYRKLRNLAWRSQMYRAPHSIV